MKKDDHIKDEENHKKITIEVPIMVESLIDGKMMSKVI